LSLSDPYFLERLMMEFPFLQQIREYVSSRGLRLEDFADPSMSPFVEAAVSRVERALVRGIRTVPEVSRQPSEVEIISYPLSVALVAMLEDAYAARRFAAVEAERYAKILESIDRGRVRDVLHYVATQVLGMRVRLASPPYEFEVHFADYLKHATRLNEPRWKLVNRVLRAGYVALRRPEMATLVKNVLETHIESRLREVGKVGVPDFLKPYVERLKKLVEVRRWREVEVKERLSPDAWPPCMQALKQKLAAGEPISHFGNFAFAAFALSIGMQPEEVVQMYSQRGDFDNRIARYQVEHIAGLRGSRTKYTTPSCSTMQTHGLCIENGRLCGGVKNPMEYYRRKARAKAVKDRKAAESSGGQTPEQQQ